MYDVLAKHSLRDSSHALWGTLLSDLHVAEGGLKISGYEMLKRLEGVRTHEHSERLPIVENSQDIPALAASIKAVLLSGEISGLRVARIRQVMLTLLICPDDWGVTFTENRMFSTFIAATVLGYSPNARRAKSV